VVLVIKIFRLSPRQPGVGPVVSATGDGDGRLYAEVAGVNVNGVVGTVTGTTFR
jgi:hypothetical protein